MQIISSILGYVGSDMGSVVLEVEESYYIADEVRHPTLLPKDPFALI
jgi:hypothetical protein